MAQYGRENGGSRTGGGMGAVSGSVSALDRREQLRRLALERIDLNKDPYLMKNHLGTYECRLCHTLHNNESSYLAHTQGKRHQQNISIRAIKDARDRTRDPSLPSDAGTAQRPLPHANRPRRPKIGRPGYRVTRRREYSEDEIRRGLTFEVDLPEVGEGVLPTYRVMSSFEILPRPGVPPADPRYRTVAIAAEPYETIAFRIPAAAEMDRDPVDKSKVRAETTWDKDTKRFTLQLWFKAVAPQSLTQEQAETNPTGT